MPALAFKNLEGCDLVTFAAKGAPVQISLERWQSYRQQAEALLAEPRDGSAKDWRDLAAKLVTLQKTLLEPDKTSDAYQSFVAGDQCRVLAKIDRAAIDRLLTEAASGLSETAASSLRGVVRAALTQMDRIERSARFRSAKDKTAMAAQYYCFVAGAVAGLLPQERRETLSLEDFGETAPCKEIGRAL